MARGSSMSEALRAGSRFGQVCEKSLATYERAIQSCCVGWRAPPLNDFLDPLVARDPPSVA